MLTVGIDDRIRTTSALLAATDWPELEQQPLPRGVHTQATALRRHVRARPYPSLAAVQQAAQYAQGFVDRFPEPVALFEQALINDPALTPLLGPFAQATSLDEYWKAHERVWQEAIEQVEHHIRGVDFSAMFETAIGIAPLNFYIYPNLAFPTNLSLGAFAADTVYCIMPPRKAVGESPPWPFADDRDHILKLAIREFCRATMRKFYKSHPGLLPRTANLSNRLPPHFRAAHPAWPDQVCELYGFGVTVIYLNRIERGMGDALTLYEKRSRGLDVLPDVVNVVNEFLERREGGSSVTLANYLPTFAQRMAQLIIS